MRIMITNDPRRIGLRSGGEEAYILRSDADRMKAMIADARQRRDKKIARIKEITFADDMRGRYGREVATELLRKVWTASADDLEEEDA